MISLLNHGQAFFSMSESPHFVVRIVNRQFCPSVIRLDSSALNMLAAKKKSSLPRHHQYNITYLSHFYFTSVGKCAKNCLSQDRTDVALPESHGPGGDRRGRTDMGRSTLFVSLRSSSFVENQDGMTSLVPADPRARPTRGRAILRRKHPGHLEADQRPRSFYHFRTAMPARQPARRSCRGRTSFLHFEKIPADLNRANGRRSKEARGGVIGFRADQLDVFGVDAGGEV